MTTFIGRAWIPNDTSLDTSSYQCKCVQDGKVQLVATTLPDDLCQPHRNGEWCPCEGTHKKWIYLNKPSTSDQKCCGLQMCSGTCHPPQPKKNHPTTEQLMALLVDQSEIIMTLTSLLKDNATDEPIQKLQPITHHEHTITQLQTHITQMELQHIEERRIATSRLNELIEVKAQLLEETDERLFLQQKLDSSTINLQQLRQQIRLAQHNYKY